MIVILTLTAVALSVLTIKIKRLVWSDDKILPLVLVFMTGSIVMNDFYFMVQVGVFNKIGWGVKNSYIWAYMLTFYTGDLMLLIGSVLNVHKWI